MTLAAAPGHPVCGRATDVARGRLVAGRYATQQLIGRGMSKDVFQAQDRKLGDREVALALISGAVRHGIARERVLREVYTTARLDSHPHIVTVHDFGEDGDDTYIVSQLVRGGSAADWVARAEPGLGRVRTAVGIAHQIAGALAYAHGAGVIHRDVKPGNILLDRDGTALLADFGVALLAERPRLTEELVVVGSAAYMSPEQADAQPIGDRSDMYALGATLFELVCGRPPFDGDEVLAVLLQHIRQPPPDPRHIEPCVPDPLAELILWLLAKDPADRPASAAELVVALAGVLDDGPAVVARPVAAVPMPAPIVAGTRRPFVGRDAALASLRALWRESAPDRRSLALISGEAGIGKTRLAAAFAEDVGHDDALVLYGRCDRDALVSYQPFVEALRHLLTHRPGLALGLDAHFELELAELARLIPELRHDRRAAGDGAEPQRHLLFDAVVALLGAAGPQRVLLVLDDLQWADRPTLLLLRHVLRARAGGLVILGTQRTHDEPVRGAAPLDPLGDVRLELLRHAAGPDRLLDVALEGLDEEETGALVALRAEGDERHDADRAFVRALYEGTSGNPFFIEELLRQLRQSELSARSLAALGVPDGAQEVIGRRLALLSDEALELLVSAAVCGREFRLDVLTEVLGRPAARLVGPLEEAMEAGLVVEPAIGRFVFCHALVRETLYAQIRSAAGRARRHLAVAEALEKLDGTAASLSELTRHFHAAVDVGGAERTVRYALPAAAAAADALAYEEAASLQERALDALSRLPADRRRERLAILESLGRLRWQVGDTEAARDAFRAKARLARELGDGEQLARAALGFGGRWYDAERTDDELVALLREALAALPDAEAPVRAKAMARLAQALRPADPEGAAALGRQALAMARRIGHDEALIDALAALHAALLHVEHLDERLTLGAEWLALAGRGSHRDDALALACSWRIYDLYEAGDVAGARAQHERLHALAASLRQPLYFNFATSWEFKWLESAGHFDRALAKARESHRYGRQAQGSYVDSLFAGQVFGVLRDQGRLPEVFAVVEQFMGGRPTLGVWRAGIVLADVHAGREDRARQELQAFVDDRFASIPRDAFWLAAMCILAEAAAALRDTAAAAALREALAPFAHCNAQIGLAIFLGPVALFSGMAAATLGRREDAERDFRHAIARSAALGARTSEAYAQCAYGEMLGAAGSDGRALLQAARASAEELAMGTILQRATRGLADGG